MNIDILRELEGDVPLMTQRQLRFLDNVKLVLENKISNDNPIYLAENEEEIVEIMEKISAIEENLKTIIGLLKSGRSSRRNFLENYLKWKKVREDCIEKLKEIAQSIQADRFNSNVSKLVGYSASFIGSNISFYS